MKTNQPSRKAIIFKLGIFLTVFALSLFFVIQRTSSGSLSLNTLKSSAQVTCPTGVYGSCNVINHQLCDPSDPEYYHWKDACGMGGTMEDCCDQSMELACPGTTISWP